MRPTPSDPSIRALFAFGVVLAAVSLACAERAAPPPATPAAAIEELLAADRAFAAASADTDLVTGTTAMLAADALMPIAGAGFAEGVAGITESLRADSLNRSARATWTPVRAGVSADGQQGFTVGWLEVNGASGASGTRVPGKYLAYWIRSAQGWRVVAYKRARRAAGPVDTTMLAAMMPGALVPVSTDSALLESHRASLTQAEHDFSRDAQTMGIGEAFVAHGATDAIHLGSPQDTAFIVGNEAIGRSVGAGSPPRTSPVTWAPDHRVIVASSGDLGVTVGYIVVKAVGGNAQPRAPIPFFTVWRRTEPGGPWRYVAE